jgi:hypothetical protein
MESTTHALPTPTTVAESTRPVSHPTPCPPWCKDRGAQARHDFGPTVTCHWSPQYQIPNPTPMDATGDTLLRAELVRLDEGDEIGRTRMYVSGESATELDPTGADIAIAHVQAVLDTMRAMRRHMG